MNPEKAISRKDFLNLTECHPGNGSTRAGINIEIVALAVNMGNVSHHYLHLAVSVFHKKVFGIDRTTIAIACTLFQVSLYRP